ncbi:hypothetical protein ABIA35_009931, partial [Catenulispora sp. MAP12-49]
GTAETKKSGRRPWEVEDGLWERIEPLLPQVEHPHSSPGFPAAMRPGTRLLAGLVCFMRPAQKGS